MKIEREAKNPFPRAARGSVYENVPARRGSRLCDSGASSLPAPSRRLLRGSGGRWLAGYPTQGPEMRRGDSPRWPLELGGARSPLVSARSHRARPPPSLELLEAQRSRCGGGAAGALGWWRHSHPRRSPTLQRPLGGDAPSTGCVRGAPAGHGCVDRGPPWPAESWTFWKTQGAFNTCSGPTFVCCL